MYITPPIPVTGNPFSLPNPRPTSGSPPVAIQITNNSSYVIGFTTGAEQNFIDPYTRSTFPITTITQSIPMTPVYNAYALVGAGYVAADWLLDNEPASQPDGALPISQLITQAIQSITSNDGSVSITNPNGPNTDLSVAQSVVPTGAVMMFGANPAPAGWLSCDGSAVSRAAQSRLYAVIGTNFGVGDGSTTFNLPNLSGRFPTHSNSPGGTGGAINAPHTHTLSSAGAAEISMSALSGSSTINMGRIATPNWTTNIANTTVLAFAGTSNTQSNGAALIGNTDSNAPPITPPYLQLNFIIKT